MHVWGKLRTNKKVIRDAMVPVDHIDSMTWFETIDTLCTMLDIPHPIILSKHEKELDVFRLTRFNSDDFMETIAFDWFEINLLVEKKENQ